MRLTPLGHEIGLVTEERYQLMESKCRQRDEFMEWCSRKSVSPAQVAGLLSRVGSSPLKQSVKLRELVLRPQLTVALLSEALPELKEYIDKNIEAERRSEIIEAAEVLMKYQGYIDREQMIADKIRRLEDVKLGSRIDYMQVQSLSTEARQKLERIRPETVAQASRIPGISPSDVNILLLLMGR